MEFSSFFFHLLFFGQIFQLSNTIVSSAKVQIPAQDGPTDMLDSLTGQIPSFDSFARTFNNSHPTDVDIGKRLVQHRIKRDNDDAVYIDHRESLCIDAPRNQGNCRASYAFAIIAFYEWLFCQKTGHFQHFSEQYIIDCGNRHGNHGCNGGNPVKALTFSQDCGFELRGDYPFTGTLGSCRYGSSIPSANMGRLRIYEESLTYIPLNQLAEHLQFGPIVVVIETSQQFLSYSGGVDNNVGHSPNNMHAMLLIGHGREDGQDYWLFKNSLFTSRSDGYYKLNKTVNCLRGQVGIGVNRPILA